MKRLSFNPVLVLVLLLLSAEACAATGIDNANVLDNILERFASTASLWSAKMVSYGTWLFWGLTLLSMVWTYGLMAMRKADIQEFLAETIRFFSVTGFFLWILQNGPAIAMAIINSMRQVASEASGLSRLVSPSSIVDIGFDIAAKVADTSSIWSPASSTVGLIIAAVILVVLALVGVNMLLMLVSAWLLAYGGVFLLGFGGGRWTQDIAINYYKTVLGIAMQTFTMILIVGIGKSFIDQYYAAMGGDMAIKELFIMLVVSIILLVLVNKLPPMIAGIVGGGGSGGGVGGLGMGAALGATGMAAGMAAGAASAALGAGASTAGGASALKAAFTAAQQSMAAGSGGGGSSGGGLVGAVESAGRFATAMGTSLAQGAADVAKEKMSAMKEAASARIADTMGGQIASKINEANEINSGAGANTSSDASNDNSLQPVFGSDSLGPARASGGQGTPPVNDEVAAFASKSSFSDARS